MITMVDKQTIINRYRVDGHSQRRISRDLHLNRKTVRRIIDEYEQSLSAPFPDQALEQVLLSHPSYNSIDRPKIVLTEEVVMILKGFFADNKRKLAFGMSKQLMFKSDMYEQLQLQSIPISYSTVCKYVSSLELSYKEKYKPAFIRQEYSPGEICEFDWGEVKLHIGTVPMKFNMAVFTLAYSNSRHAYLFRHQDTLAFMESHRNFFAEVKGVPYQMVYDNMRVAIKQFVGNEKHPTQGLLSLSNFYQFTFRFCNVRAGWEKGHVERGVEVVRRKAFSICFEFSTIADAQSYLFTVCQRLNNQSLSPSTVDKQSKVALDISSLQPFINKIGCFEMEQYKVDKWSTICMKKAHYSVPDHLVGKYVDVKIYSEKIIVYQDGKIIAEHQRMYTPGGWSIELCHYIRTLLHKPGSVASSTALGQLPQKVRDMYDVNFRNNPKDFVLLIQYAAENNFSNDDLIKCYETLKDSGMNSPSLDQLKASLHVINEPLTSSTSRDEQTEQRIAIENGSVEILNSLTSIMDNKTECNTQWN